MKKIFLPILIILGFFLSSFIYAQIATPDPIILIPGLGASWNSDVMWNNISVNTTWGFTDGVKNYDVLIDNLVAKGYVLNETLFIAHYDWRQSNINSATNYLIPVIDQALQNSETGKVDIIAHSMGGLVARAYIQDIDYRNDVDQLFLLGTPNAG
ncbi:MAG: alpha/beta hydrolase, partial [Patescibacteria group bacterium]